MLTVDQKTFPVSWDQLHRDSRALAWRLVALGPFQGIVAITRGGLVPAAVIARDLDVRLIDTVCIASHRADNSPGAMERSEERRAGKDRARTSRSRSSPSHPTTT